jgi:putative endonuclease
MKDHNYYVYILTNPGKTVLYVGVTNNLSVRLNQHKENRGKPETFAGKYYCYKLVYWENYKYVRDAIIREKELKLLNRVKKIDLIKTINPTFDFIKFD